MPNEKFFNEMHSKTKGWPDADLEDLAERLLKLKAEDEKQRRIAPSLGQSTS